MNSTDPTSLFVDILGFGALIEQHPQERAMQAGPASFTVYGATPSTTMFYRFHRVIDQGLSAHVSQGQVTVTVFSDCAFVILATPSLLAVKAAELMRSFIRDRVPVRMGMAKGTFAVQRFSIDMIGTSRVHRSMFSGTAVVRAHRAEQSGAKGLRILLHPSLKGDFAAIESQCRVLPLPQSFPAAAAELSYIADETVGPSSSPTADEEDHELLSAVREMNSKSPPAESVHYTDTIAARNRMRVALGRRPFTNSSAQSV